MRTIKWDGREHTANRILDMLPAGEASYWGGAPGFPRELFVGKSDRKVARGARVGLRGRKAFIARTEGQGK